MVIKVALTGVGNCASALVQGVEYYKDIENDEEIPGVMHAYFGGYHIRDIKFVAAFEVNKYKVGTDLSKAIWAKPNSCYRFAEVSNLGVEVQPGPISDAVAPHMFDSFYVSEDHKAVDVADHLKSVDADVLVNYLPVGSKIGTQLYAEAAIDAECAFVNCIPEFIASDESWGKRFKDAGLPVAGDDIKSQVGATIVHRALAELFHARGVKIDSTYQLNIGGNTDFENMTVESRLTTKRVSKTEAVKSLLPYDVPTKIGPSDYVPFLGDQKICYISIQGHGFGRCAMDLDLKLRVQDSPNSAGVVIDVIRAVKLALDRGISGPLTSISAYSFKHPPLTMSDHVAREHVEEYILGKRES